MPGRGSFRIVMFMSMFTAVTCATTACGGGSDNPQESRSVTPPTASTGPTASATPTTSATTPAPQTFRSEITKVTAADLKYSWRQGCPVAPSGLRMLKMTYWGMDDKTHLDGRLVVNATAARDLIKVFQRLYDIRYPISRMEPVDRYKGSDFDSIEANNTSAFNCRNATGSSSFSQHAYGLALDLNPCENPYVYADGRIAHQGCTKYKNRRSRAPGVIHAGDKVVKAFASIGWGWGGEWSGAKDYQHFSSSEH